MAGVDEQAKKDKKESVKKFEKVVETGQFDKGGQSGRGDIEEEDMQESYFKFVLLTILQIVKTSLFMLRFLILDS